MLSLAGVQTAQVIGYNKDLRETANKVSDMESKERWERKRGKHKRASEGEKGKQMNCTQACICGNVHTHTLTCTHTYTA